MVLLKMLLLIIVLLIKMVLLIYNNYILKKYDYYNIKWIKIRIKKISHGN